MELADQAGVVEWLDALAHESVIEGPADGDQAALKEFIRTQLVMRVGTQEPFTHHAPI